MFLQERIIAIGGEGTDIVFYSLEDVTSKPLGHFEAHDKRYIYKLNHVYMFYNETCVIFKV